MENQPLSKCLIPLHKPSRKELVFFFVSGILVSIPIASFFEGFYPTQFSAALYFVVFAPFVEELAKVFPLFYRHGETERSIVTLGLLMGLGFGIAEFSEYVFLYGQSPIGRISSLILHSSSATITAYGVAKKKPLPYYLLAVVLHASANFFAIAGGFLYVFGIVLVLVTIYLLAWRYYQQSSKEKMVV
jgi:RsiW-degrading membrane proteinase PrsW (M82 family)